MIPIWRLCTILGFALVVCFWSTGAEADQVACTTNGSGTETCDIYVPNVLESVTDYPGVTFAPGDVVTVAAGGCVQTGGTGRTWKRYVDPSGNKSDRLYHGLIAIPGATAGLVRISSVTGPLTVTATGTLKLGYEDDDFGDNGYWSPDDGTDGQCDDPDGDADPAGHVGKAWVRLVIQRADPAAATLGGHCVSIGANLERCRIDRPDMTMTEEPYPGITLRPGDQAAIVAGGCAQTGGIGETWKDYVNPSGPNASDVMDHGVLIRGRYRGLISIPGVTAGLVRLSTVVGRTDLAASSGGTVLLGYEDEYGGYADNGYWSHDDGTDDQCENKGPAFVELTVTRAPKLPGAHVAIDALEVVQSVQNISQTVPLVADKLTYVRAYLTRLTPLNPPVGKLLTLTGKLRATLASGATVDVIALTPVVAQANETLRGRRERLNRSLNFMLPNNVTAPGTVRLELIELTETTGGSALCEGCGTPLSAEFLASPPLRLTAIGLGYTVTGGAMAAPSQQDLDLFGSWVQRAYPTAAPDYGMRTVVANDGWPFTCEDANAQVAAIRGNDMSNGANPRVHYYGLVSDQGGFMRGCATSSPSHSLPSAVASGPAGNPATSGINGIRNAAGTLLDTDASYGDWYGGHELGHTLGRPHPGFCFENSADDPTFPFPNGQISDAVGSYVGFDSGDFVQGLAPTALAGTATFDVMTYCMPVWPSAFAYQAIRQRLIDENMAFDPPSRKTDEDAATSGVASDGGFGGATPGPATAARDLRPVSARGLVHVVATLDLSGKRGRFRYVTPVKSGTLAQKANNQVVIRAVASDGRVIADYPAEYQVTTDKLPSEARTATVDATLRIDPRVSRLELHMEGRVVDTFASLSSPPAAPRAGRIVSGQAKDGFAYELQWTDVRRRTGETIRYLVEMGDGSLWTTIGIGRASNRLRLTAGQARAASLRVTASNGFRNSEPLLIKGLR